MKSRGQILHVLLFNLGLSQNYYEKSAYNKEAWDWVCKVEDQVVFLFGILPYTIIKRAQIIEALNYHFEKQNGGKLTEDEYKLRSAYYERLKTLK